MAAGAWRRAASRQLRHRPAAAPTLRGRRRTGRRRPRQSADPDQPGITVEGCRLRNWGAT
ncbi:hypothetical protein ACPA9J_30995 [Pseudomonas aeruginosa]